MLNSDGNKEWAKTFGIFEITYAYSAQQTTDGGYVVTGNTRNFSGSVAFVLKLDTLGNQIWVKTFGGIYCDVAYSIQQTTDGGYIVSGYTQTGSYSTLVLKLDSSGNIMWAKKFQDAGTDSARAVQQTADGGYIVAGSTSIVGAGQGDAFVFKLDSFGNKVWAKTFGSIYAEEARSVQQTTDGGYIVVGSTRSVHGNSNGDILILKLDANGNVKNDCWGQDVSWQTTDATLTVSIVDAAPQNAAALTLASADSLVLTDLALTTTTICSSTNITYIEDTECSLAGITVVTSSDTVTARLILNDQNAGALTVATSGAVTSAYNAATGVWEASGNKTDINSLLAGLRYQPSPNYYGSFSIAVSIIDGYGQTANSTISLMGTAVNDAPVITVSSEPISYTEDSVPVVIASTLSITDVDSANLKNATVAITDGFNAAEDVLSFAEQSGIIGNYSSSNGTLVFTGIAPIADYQALLRTVAYKDTSQNPSTENRTITFQVTDEEGATSEAVTKTIQVIAVNDQPVVNFPLRNQTGCCGARIGEAYNFTFAANTFFDADSVKTSSVLRFADSPNERKLTGFSRVKESQTSANNNTPMIAGLGAAGAVGIGLFSYCFFQKKRVRKKEKKQDLVSSSQKLGMALQVTPQIKLTL